MDDLDFLGTWLGYCNPWLQIFYAGNWLGYCNPSTMSEDPRKSLLVDKKLHAFNKMATGPLMAFY